MSNPRNLLSQQDTVDNLTSTSVVFPLSANQGRLLQNEINNLPSSGVQSIKAAFSNQYNGVFYILSIGTLEWEAATNQLILRIIDTDLVEATMNSSIKNINVPTTTDQFLEIRGNYSVVVDTAYYLFSENGLLNTGLNMDNTDTAVMKIGLMGDELDDPSYSLEITAQRQENGNILVDGFLFTHELGVSNFIGFPMEANGLPASGNECFSFGGRENATDVGQVLPFPVLFTTFSYTFAGTLGLPISNTFAILRNGELTGSTVHTTGGVLRQVNNVSSPVGFAQGDRLSFRRLGSFSFVAIPVDATISGRILS